MYLLKGDWTEEKLKVEIIYNLEAEENSTISTDDGVVVEEYPKYPEHEAGKIPVLCANTTGEVWFEFEDVPLTLEQQLQKQLEQQQALIDMLILDSLGGAE